jgi:hypothetical protein
MDFPGDEKERVIHSEAWKFPLRISEPILFGYRGQGSSGHSLVRSGTATLIEIEKRQIAVTCNHVLELYLKRRSEDASISWQVAERPFDPAERLIDKDEYLDLATFDVSGLELEQDRIEFLPLQFYRPYRWPLASAKVGEIACLGGYPEVYRSSERENVISSGSWSLSAAPVTDVEAKSLICAFDRSTWRTDVKADPSFTTGLMEFSGLSGGPVLVLRALAFELVGFIFQQGITMDFVRAVNASRMRGDGTILHADERDEYHRPQLDVE